MMTIIRKLVLIPLLAVLVAFPVYNTARADDFLGLGWWIVPIAIGGVAIYEIGRHQADDSSQHAVYAPSQQVAYEQPQQGYVPPQKVYIQPAPVYNPQHWYEQPPTYYQQQYGYVMQ